MNDNKHADAVTGSATYYLESDVDTDIIIPARFLKRTYLDNFEPFAFFERRYSSETICQPSLAAKDFVFEKTVLNPDFPPNHPNCKDALFLLTWNNFGCGSSREHAVYSLSNYRVIIGSSPKGKTAFADIFRENCKQNLIWTPVISPEDHALLKDCLLQEIAKHPVQLQLDKTRLTISTLDKSIEIPFTIPQHHLKFFAESEVSPFATAERGISADLEKIIDWEKQNATLVASYPKSAT